MAFEFDGKKYQKVSTHQKEWGGKLINELNQKGDEWIIDLGCGDGAITAQLADLVPNGRGLGIDVSQSMIKATRNHQRSNLSFMLKDIHCLDFKDEFDLIFSNAILRLLWRDEGQVIKAFRNARSSTWRPAQ